MPFFLKRFFLRFLLILRTGGLFILVLLVGYRYLDQSLTEKIQDEIFNEDGMTSWVWVYAACSLALTLIFPVAVTLFTVGALKSRSLPALWDFIRRKTSELVREQMRALGMALLWGIPLVIPTFWKLFQFTFVPFVVCLDPQYALGNIHAPSRSSELVRRRFWSTAIITSVLFVFLPLFMVGLEDLRSWTDSPFSALVILTLEFTFTILGQLVLIRIWEKAHGSEFQVA